MSNRNNCSYINTVIDMEMTEWWMDVVQLDQSR